MAMGSAQARTRGQQSVQITQFGTKQIVPLGRGQVYRELMLEFVGTMTFAAGANNVAATFGRGDEWSAIQRVDVVANGSTLLRSFSGSQLVWINRLLYGGYKRPQLQIGDGVTAAPAFDSCLIIPFWMPQSIRPMDTALDSGKLQDLRLEVTIDNPANIVAAPNSPTAINAQIVVGSYECFFPPNSVLNFSDFLMTPMQLQTPGANSRAQLQLPVTALYRGFLINQSTGTANNSSDTTGAISSLKLQSGGTIFREFPSWRMMVDWQRARLGWNRDVVPNAAQSPNISAANAVYMRSVKSGLADEDGWGFMDLCNDGFLTEGIDTQGFAELYLEFNVTAAATITVFPLSVFPNRTQPAPAAA